MVTFRIPADEYEDLAKWCAASGARSVSDFARASVRNNMAAMRTPAGTISGDLVTLGRSLAELDLFLLDLRRRISALLGRPGSEEESKYGDPEHNRRSPVV